MFNSKRILVLAPHPEDGELGCGATIAKSLENGAEVFYAAFTIAEKSTLPPFDSDQQRKELGKAVDILGIKEEYLHVKNWEVRTFNEHRQEILDYMLVLRKEIEPDLVFCHSRDDIHQDHTVITDEAIRAFKKCNMLGYELPWNNFKFTTDCFSVVTKEHMEKKGAAVACYDSRSYRPYINPEKISAWATTRGMQIEQDFAECFEVIRLFDR